MKTILYSLLVVALIASTSYGNFLDFNQSENDLQAAPLSPYITFIDDSLIDNLMLQLQGQTDFVQYQIIQYFVYNQRKFFNANSIMKVLMVLKDNSYPDLDQIRKTAISLMEPYIAPLSTDEAIQILQMIDPSDGIASGILVSQVYDLYGNTVNQNNLTSLMNGYGNQNRNQIILPQSTKSFRNNFLLTYEGKHVGFLVDQSESMNTIAYTKSDGTTVTRYAMLQQFYSNRFDIFQNFFAFSYQFLGNQTTYSCDSCSTGSYEQAKAFNSLAYNILKCGGQNDLYQKLSQLANKLTSTLSDIYIWSDGIVTQYPNSINDFLALIDSINVQRRIKIRINTVSFLVGGNEDANTRNAATNLLKTLADSTKGTFIQVQPNMNQN